MARRSLPVTLVAAIAALWPVSAQAVTAPAAAPQLTSAPFASPAVFTWTPGVDPLNTTQTIYRSPGTCAAPVSAAVPVRVYDDNAQSQHFAVPGDGTWCFSVRTTDSQNQAASSPGLTLSVDTTAPQATVAIAGQTSAGRVAGVVGVSGTSADAVSGVASSVLHVGSPGACATGAVVGASWDTTGFVDGAYEACNVVTDRAGLATTATVAVTVANAIALMPAGVTPPLAAPAGVVLQNGTVVDRTAPGAPVKLAVTLPRVRNGSAPVAVTLRWVNPKAADLDRVVVILNARRPPRSTGDGSVVYRGLRTSATFKLRPGKSGHLALYAYDRSGNVSRPARRVVSLASLIPLRPLTGSTVAAAPLLTWKRKDGSAYYNVQIFRDGKRIAVGWPSQPAYRLPVRLLEPGTYTWLVWPALRRESGTVFADLIGRATFVYKG